MVKHVQEVKYKVSEFDESEQARYSIQIITNKKGKINELHIAYRIYPLGKRGYGNYQELNVSTTKLIKYTHIDIYWIRDSWNGSGYFPICSTRLELDDEFFNIIVGNNNVKAVVIRLFQQLKDIIENIGEDDACFYATRYFPV
jgi:hypothetical protein